MEQLFAKSAPEWTGLHEHLEQVSIAVVKFAKYLGLDENLAVHAAILHDIGKVHPFFQERLLGKNNSRKVYRHEIGSLFFLSAFPKVEWNPLIEMIVAHHKSVRNDYSKLGLLDLEENDDYIDFHLGDWELWSKKAILILKGFGINCNDIPKQTAIDNLEYVIEYVTKISNETGYSVWRGLLMGADHFASAMIKKTETKLKYLFKSPNLTFYNRQNSLYPLSYVNANDSHKHTLVVASTGAGKTDFLFRRCRGRVFYTLPFQASINAMYKRVGNDLEKDNPCLDIRVQHSSSVIVKRKEDDDTSLQTQFGSSVKILTPHQFASIAFGQKGFEKMLLDVKGCDVVLDEVHTYSGISQALVLKLIEILNLLGCRIHVGTATMPSVLYNKIKNILRTEVLEIKLSDNQLETFNRHIIYKLESFNLCWEVIENAVNRNEKVLIVLNKVSTAQEIFAQVSEQYPTIPSLLLHSRFKRGDRNDKETLLLGLDKNGNPTGDFNTSNGACIVVSTQIVEVSLDISFDIMITEAAPLDALIQRFGRINRKRTKATLGSYKPIYVVAPGNTDKDVKPYDLGTILKTYEVLEDGVVLEEKTLQDKIDKVFPEINFISLEEHTIFKSDGKMTIDKLTHSSEPILLQLLEIDSVVCILESDIEDYENTINIEYRLQLEIPVYYYSVAKMEQSKKGNKPFIVPDVAYSYDLGLDVFKIKDENFNVINRFL